MSTCRGGIQLNLVDPDQDALVECRPATTPGPGPTEDAVGERASQTVPLASLVPGEPLRSEGVDQQHIIRLAEVDTLLPPILVERRSMRVIDGMHRWMAAMAKGRATIEVQFFEGSREDAFLRAVEANVVHGLPLSQADRRAAATRIITSHPHLSDRAIARISGMSARTVATIRRGSTDAALQSNIRVGRDGRVRPLDAARGRQRAAELIAERPQSSLREVALLAGISPATVRDVRRRLQAGEPPLPVLGEPSGAGATGASVEAGPIEVAAEGRTLAEQAGWRAEPVTAAGDAAQVRSGRQERSLRANPILVLEKLLRDPSLRQKEGGRHLLRLLQLNAVVIEKSSDLIAVVPPHCGALVADLARQYAETWLGFAQDVDNRAGTRSGPGNGHRL